MVVDGYLILLRSSASNFSCLPFWESSVSASKFSVRRRRPLVLSSNDPKKSRRTVGLGAFLGLAGMAGGIEIEGSDLEIDSRGDGNGTPNDFHVSPYA